MPVPAHRRPSRNPHRARLPVGPVRTDSAIAAGWTKAAQRHAIAAGDLERVRRGVVAVPVGAAPGSPQRVVLEAIALRKAEAATVTCGRAAISHKAAAIAHGIPTIGDLNRICVTVTSGTALRSLAGVHLHRATVTSDEVVDIGGYPVLSPQRTVMDIAREFGVPAGVVAADHALHRDLISHGELAAAFTMCSTWPGRRAARIVLGFADGRAESPLESLSRLQCAAFRLPRPEPQQRIGDRHRRFLGRGDFYWDEFGVVGESDGDLKYADGQESIVLERGRQKDFEQAGLIVVRWGWSDVWNFGPAGHRLWTAFGRGARPGSADRNWTLLPDLRLHPPVSLTGRIRRR